MRVRRHWAAASEPRLALVGAGRPRDRHWPCHDDRGHRNYDCYGDNPVHVVLHLWIEPAIRRGRLDKGGRRHCDAPHRRAPQAFWSVLNRTRPRIAASPWRGLVPRPPNLNSFDLSMLKSLQGRERLVIFGRLPVAASRQHPFAQRWRRPARYGRLQVKAPETPAPLVNWVEAPAVIVQNFAYCLLDQTNRTPSDPRGGASILVEFAQHDPGEHTGDRTVTRRCTFDSTQSIADLNQAAVGIEQIRAAELPPVVVHRLNLPPNPNHTLISFLSPSDISMTRPP